MQPDIVFRDRVGNQNLFARAFLGGVGHQAADEGAVDRPVDDDMGDMHALGPQFARQALRQRPEGMLGAGEGGIARAAADARGRAGKEHRPPAPRNHHARRLPSGQEAREGRHLPHLGIDLRRRLGDGKAHVGADVEDQNLDRPDRPLDRVEEADDIGLVARIEPDRMRLPAVRPDARGKRLQLLDVARPAGHHDAEALLREGARDGRAEAVARPDHH